MSETANLLEEIMVKKCRLVTDFVGNWRHAASDSESLVTCYMRQVEITTTTPLKIKALTPITDCSGPWAAQVPKGHRFGIKVKDKTHIHSILKK